MHAGEDCMEKFCESLREQPEKIINFQKKKTKSMNHILIKETGTFAKKSSNINILKIKIIVK